MPVNDKAPPHFALLGKPNGVLTFSTNGIPHVELEESFGRALDGAYKRGLKEGLKRQDECQ